jgi:hypothetical protein
MRFKARALVALVLDGRSSDLMFVERDDEGGG